MGYYLYGLMQLGVSFGLQLVGCPYVGSVTEYGAVRRVQAVINCLENVMLLILARASRTCSPTKGLRIGL